MTSWIGLNVLKHDHNDRLLYWCGEAEPRLMVVMNNAALADALALLLPQSRIIARFWPDDNIHQFITPAAWLQQMVASCPALLARANLYAYAGNEPTERAEYPQHAAWTLQAMQLADSAGVKLCILNHGAGRPNKDEWPIYTDVITYAAMSDHIIGMHEYGVFDLRTSPPWLIGRIRDLFDLYQEFPRDKVCITEFGLDAIAQFPGSSQYRALGISDSDYAAQIIAVYESVYRSLGIWGAAVFGWGDSGGWEYADVSDATTLQNMFMVYEWENEPVATPVWKLWELLQTMNVRSSPEIARNEIAKWFPGMQFMRRMDGTVESNGFTWHEVEYGTVRGWMASIEGNMQRVEDTTPPDPDPDPTNGQRLDDLEAQMVQVMDRLDALEAVSPSEAHQSTIEVLHLASDDILQAWHTVKEYCEEELKPSE